MLIPTPVRFDIGLEIQLCLHCLPVMMCRCLTASSSLGQSYTPVRSPMSPYVPFEIRSKRFDVLTATVFDGDLSGHGL